MPAYVSYWPGYVYMIGVLLGFKMILVPDPRDTKLIYDYMVKYRPMFLLGAPTQFMRLSELEGADLKKIKRTVALSGMAMLSDEVANKYSKKVGGSIGQAYGQTETTAIITINLPYFLSSMLGRKLPGNASKSVGIPFFDTDIKIIDIDSKKEVPFGQPGEICARGPQVMLGYWPTPGKGLDDDGYIHTGDVGYMDEDGFLYIVDRTKDMINVSGFKVYGKVVEDVVYEHPAVMMAGAVGVPDADRPGSERVKLFLQLKKGYEPSKELEDELIKLCKEKLAPYAVPKFVEFIEEMPILHTEKIDKKALRKGEQEKLGK